MTTTRLSRHYPSLTAEERFSLLLAAAAREDATEHARLAATAPRVIVQVPHSFFRAMAFREVFEWHRMERLELAALAFETHRRAEIADDEIADRLTPAVGLYGYLVRVNRAGWERFCDRAKTTSSALEVLLPGQNVLRMADEWAEVNGFSAEEAAEYIARLGGGSPDRLLTAESVAADLVVMFEARVAWWDAD